MMNNDLTLIIKVKGIVDPSYYVNLKKHYTIEKGELHTIFCLKGSQIKLEEEIKLCKTIDLDISSILISSIKVV